MVNKFIAAYIQAHKELRAEESTIVNFDRDPVKHPNLTALWKANKLAYNEMLDNTFGTRLAYGRKEVRLVNAWLNVNYGCKIIWSKEHVLTSQSLSFGFLSQDQNIFVETVETIRHGYGGGPRGFTSIYGEEALIKQVKKEVQAYKKQVKSAHREQGDKQMDKDALIKQLVAALNGAVPYIGYSEHVPDLQKAAAEALAEAQKVGFESSFGKIYVEAS